MIVFAIKSCVCLLSTLVEGSNRPQAAIEHFADEWPLQLSERSFSCACSLRQTPCRDDLLHASLELRSLHGLLPHLLAGKRLGDEQRFPEQQSRRDAGSRCTDSRGSRLLVCLRFAYSGPVANWLAIDSVSATTAATPMHRALRNCGSSAASPSRSSSFRLVSLIAAQAPIFLGVSGAIVVLCGRRRGTGGRGHRPSERLSEADVAVSQPTPLTATYAGHVVPGSRRFA
jgi:hypothetical protein